ncbi:MAG: NAD(P)(+) transhydrogenase (Re/Si-specific) subunit beta [Fimbriimonadales bacterium]|nr:NAD(P)(+) transhydrogenase (Re/Si-specific) subunit beta [Fimbriimonadales bacterium]
MSIIWIRLCYIVAAVCFVMGLKLLSHPRTARMGNAISAFGMLLAIGATLFHHEILDFRGILLGVLVGTIAGALMARLVAMTAMPQMVALLNGFGGAASALVAMDEHVRGLETAIAAPLHVLVTIPLSVLVGTVTFSGSLLAFGKLQEIVTGRAVTFPLQKPLNALLLLGALALVIALVFLPGDTRLLVTLALLGLVLGVMGVIPIGGADMPVVISLLNSYSGVAAALTGFVINNYGLIISGALVGASGLILTNIMCKAMNRSLSNVLFGAFGAVAQTPLGVTGEKTVRAFPVEDIAMIFASAKSVVIVPGYGMAVAQAQHAVKELASKLMEHGIDVKFGIHPVAGRMPGHMNVLLAEADVPYDLLYDLDAINPLFPHTDVVLVIGANDVVNPAARHDKNSPLYGMPILDVDRAKTVVVSKRSLNPGFAGVDNELFYKENTIMLFGDAKTSVTQLTSALGEYL